MDTIPPTAKKLSPQESCELTRNTHADAFVQIYARYSRRVFGICMQMTKNASDSEDLTQEVFLQVYRKMNSFRGEAAFGTWLYTVAKNHVLMHIRKRSVETVPGDISELENAPGVGLSKQTAVSTEPLRRLALIRALGALTTHRRRIFIMHDIEGRTHRELSTCLGIDSGTSKSQLHHAHLALRNEIWPRRLELIGARSSGCVSS
jgi:RNA polymerase sigma-70 factor, ECF subfamily